MTVLNYQEILQLCKFTEPKAVETNDGAIQPCVKGNVRSASYDLRLGSEYYLYNESDRSEVKISTLEHGRSECLVVPPNELVVCQVLERLVLPADVVGHLSLKVDILLKGIIFAHQSQIDAGYEGHIFALLYNLTKSTVHLRLGESLLRLELVRLNANSEKPYRGKFAGARLSNVLSAPLCSTMHDIVARVASEEKKRTRLTLTGFILTLAGIWGYGAFQSELGELKGAQTLEPKYEAIRQTLEDLRHDWSAFRTGGPQDTLPSVRAEINALNVKFERIDKALSAMGKPTEGSGK